MKKYAILKIVETPRSYRDIEKAVKGQKPICVRCEKKYLMKKCCIWQGF